jgi:hypothetical protein
MTPVGLGFRGAGDEQAMKPIRERGGALNDLLERLLNKGVVIDLDLVIGVAGIPLIGVSLRAAVAAIETMIEYGFMQAWDEDTRRYAERELQRKKLDYAPGEVATLEMFGSHWYADRIYRAWRPGRLYLTDRRLILYRKSPAEVLFETPLSSIRGMAIAESVHFNGRVTPLLHLALESEEQVSIYAEDLPALEAALHDRLQELGVPLTQTVNACERDADITQAFPDHRLLADGRMWREAPGGVAGEAATWQAGWLYLTSEGLVWWSESERRAAVRIPAADIIGVGVEERDLGPLLGERSVLGVRYRERGRQKTVLFGGRGPEEWRRGIRRLVVDYDGGGLP